MDVQVKAVHFDLPEERREFLMHKLKKIEFAEGLIVDLLFTFTKEKSTYICEANCNFRWGVTGHVRTEHHDLTDGMEQLLHKLDHKVRKEKEKITDHGAS